MPWAGAEFSDRVRFEDRRRGNGQPIVKEARMKSRLSLIFAALVVLLGAMVWAVLDRRNGAPEPADGARIVPAVGGGVSPAFGPAPQIATVPVTPAPSAPAPVLAPSRKGAPMVHVDPSGAVRYFARAGDTMSDVVIALLGSDSKDHRAAVAAANVSLQTNPDRVVAGQTYSIDTSAGESGNDDALPGPSATEDALTPVSGSKVAGHGPVLRYIARPGDTVAVLAGNLLGGDTAANREAIIAANEALRAYPSHLIAGKTYTIAVPAGMSADPDAPQVKASGVQPDADDVVNAAAGRTLRYTAKAGDTVSKLAVSLLGSDTPANQELIVQSNPSLKRDRDHLVAGQTYSISAPTGQ
jgi:hypothetical protein